MLLDNIHTMGCFGLEYQLMLTRSVEGMWHSVKVERTREVWVTELAR